MSDDKSSFVNGVINVSYTFASAENYTQVVKKERTLSNVIKLPVKINNPYNPDNPDNPDNPNNNNSGMFITKQAPSSAENNSIFTYTINVANYSQAIQSNLSVVDNLPDKFNVITNMIEVEKGNLLLQNGIDYSFNINNGILSISGINSSGLQLNIGESLCIKISGYVSL